MRIAIFLFALVASASLLPAVAHAQEGTGSISGRILVEGQPRVPYRQLFGIISADKTQSMYLGDIRGIGLDEQGNFTVSDLADGDYFLILCLPWEFAEPPGQPVPFVGPGGLRTLSGVPVTLVDGQAITDLEIVVRPLEPMPSCLENVEVPSSTAQLSPPGGLSVVITLAAPATGAGPGGGADGTVGRIAAGLAVAAAVLLAGGVALRARGRRLL